MMKKRSKRRLFHGDMAFSATSASQGHGFVAITFFLLLLSLFSLHSAEKSISICNSFNCGPLKNITYPFFNESNSNCGLGIMKCESNIPIIKFVEFTEVWFRVEKILYENQMIMVQDLVLGSSYNNNKTCPLALHNFGRHLTANLLPLELKSPFLTLFTCNRGVSHASHSQLVKTFYSYDGCPDYYIFFYNASNQNQTPPSDCQVYHIPVAASKELPPFNGTNLGDDYLTSLFGLGFQLQWILPLPPAEPKNFLKKRLIIGISSFMVGTFLITIVVFFYLKRRLSSFESIFWKKKTECAQKLEIFLRNYGSLSPKRFNYSDIKKMTNSFKDKLGKGGFGQVFKGKLLNGSLVAVKVLSESKGNGEEFINEVVTISRTSHVNIVTLIGFCVEGPKRALIYEFMPNGSLEKFIYDKKTVEGHPHLGWDRLYQIAAGIARGLEYLHRGCNTQILHFDIKPHNILLDQNFCPKISDFGLAKLCTTKESIISMMDARGTIGYIAPEVFSRNFGGVSHKSDVYSYGMMVLEMVGGRKNNDARVDHTSEIYFPHWAHKRLELDEDLGLHGVVTEEEGEVARKMILVGLWCIQTNPLNRPSMSKVLDMLEGSIESVEIPPKPYLSSPSRSPGSSPSRSLVGSSTI